MLFRSNHKSYGINVMRQMLELGTLHINENCTEFLREAQNYFVDPQGRFSDPDDAIDSCRYALLGCLNGISEEYDSRSPQQRFRDARHNMQVARLRAEREKPAWKQVYNATGS